MVNLRYLLFIKITKLLFLSCQSQTYIPDMETNNECYMHKDESTHTTASCPEDCDPIEIDFQPGKVKGSIIANFTLAPSYCTQKTYHIELMYGKTRSKNRTCSYECDDPSDKRFSRCQGLTECYSSIEYPHSKRKFSIKPCNGNCTNICGKHAQVQFFNVARGCYKANVKQMLESNNFKRRETKWIYMGDHESETSDVKIDNKYLVTNSQGMNTNMTFSKPTSYVNIKLMKNGKIIKKMGMRELLENKTCDFFKSKTDSGNITKYGGLSCSFSFSSENYSKIMVYMFKDEQCDDKLKYQENYEYEKVCWEKEERGIHVSSPKDNVEMKRAFDWNILGIIASSFIVVMMVFCILFKLLHKGRKGWNSPSIGDSTLLGDDDMNNDYEILLLYAKDCKEFMETMESFRQMLGELCNVKVYDCFYEPNWSDEQISPSDWIEKILRCKPSLHIVLVSTLSACVQRIGFLSGKLNGNVSAFRDPSCLDKIFLYGMRLIREYEMSQFAYGKIFIIKLNGFSDDADSLYLSKLSRVYQIPLHLEYLVQHMKNASCKEHFREESDYKIQNPRIVIDGENMSYEQNDFTRGESYSKFHQCLENLRAFKRSNQNYLSDMLQPGIVNQFKELQCWKEYSIQ